ncbi:MAG: hypothetical protein QM726_15500 [Chitinophagaceae bacterium]
MKKCIALIMSVYMLLSTVVPCVVFDGCDEDVQYASQSSNKESKKDCDACSPFCICSPAHNFTSNITSTTVLPVEFHNEIAYNYYLLSPITEYHSTLFQPPRIS